MSNERMQRWQPGLMIANLFGTIIVGAILSLYVHLPGTVAVHAKSIQTLEESDRNHSVAERLNGNRITELEKSGSSLAKDHIESDEKRQQITDQRLAAHDALMMKWSSDIATLVSQLATRKEQSDRMEQKLDRLEALILKNVDKP